MKPWIITAEELTVPPGNLSAEFSSKLRRADEYIRLGVAAAEKIFSSHRITRRSAERIGLLIGTAFGPMQTNFNVLGMINDIKQTSPTLFAHSVFNSAAGYVDRLFTISGVCYTFTDFAWPFFQVLATGYDAIDSGMIDGCLIMQLETYSNLLEDARKQMDNAAAPWPKGAVCWYLSSEALEGAWLLKQIEVQHTAAPPVSYVLRKENLYCEDDHLVCTTPLEAAVELTRMLNSSVKSELHCRLKAPYGSVTLTCDHF